MTSYAIYITLAYGVSLAGLLGFCLMLLRRRAFLRQQQKELEGWTIK